MEVDNGFCTILFQHHFKLSVSSKICCKIKFVRFWCGASYCKIKYYTAVSGPKVMFILHLLKKMTVMLEKMNIKVRLFMKWLLIYSNCPCKGDYSNGKVITWSIAVVGLVLPFQQKGRPLRACFRDDTKGGFKITFGQMWSGIRWTLGLEMKGFK